MSFELLIRAARHWDEPDSTESGDSLAWTALRRLRDAFPDDQRKMSSVEFARQIIAIEEAPGRIDEARLVSLVLGGGQLSEQMHRFFETLDNLTEAQKERLDQLQSQQAKTLADFFAELGIRDLFPTRENQTPRSLTEVNGIGPRTAEHLKAQGVQDLAALAAMSDDALAALEPCVPQSPGRDLTRWRTDAKTLLSKE